MTSRTMFTLFDTYDAAERAGRDLAMNVGGVRASIHDASSGTSGDWGLRDAGLPETDFAAFGEGIRRGGAVLSASVPEDHYEAALDALEASGAVELDAREVEWRREGWAGQTPAGDGGAMATGMPAAGETPLREGEKAIPLAEERLRVGKREVSHGRVRVRSYVVETPVEEQVTLRDEHVDIERRPADRPAPDADRLFQERTIEASETTEEPVVSKEARVKEDLVVSKEAGQRTETVRDTVRRTEVEIEDERGQRSGTEAGKAAADPSRDRGPGAR